MKKIKEEKETVKMPDGFHLKTVRGQQIIALKRTKSVVIPMAQYTTLCDKGTEQGDQAHELVQKVERLRSVDKRVHTIAVICLENGCRISEVLRIASGDILQNGNFVIRGLKRSHDRICSCSEARDYLLQCRKNNFAPFQEIDRFYVRRCYEKVALFMLIEGAKKRATTHALRHLYIKSAKNVIATEDIKTSIGHKSLTSTKHYEQTKERTS